MKRTILIGVTVLVAAALWFRWTTGSAEAHLGHAEKPPLRYPTEPLAPVPDVPGEARSPGLPRPLALAKPTHPSPSVARVAPNTAPLGSQRSIVPTRPQPASDGPDEYFERWSKQAPDAESTRRIRRELGEQLAEAEVHPSRVNVECGATLCRLQFVFPTVAELELLARLPRATDRSVFIRNPKQSPEGVELTVYVGVNEGRSSP